MFRKNESESARIEFKYNYPVILYVPVKITETNNVHHLWYKNRVCKLM